MNRAIKFRAWDLINKKWIELCYLEINNDKVDYVHDKYGDDWNINNCVLMQFTGFQDDDGKEICEGDIVNYSLCTNEYTGDYEYDKGIVTFDSECGYWRIADEVFYGTESIQIIGNIYENPELLENKL